MNYNMSIYKQLNPKLLVQVRVGLNLLNWANISNISLTHSIMIFENIFTYIIFFNKLHLIKHMVCDFRNYIYLYNLILQLKRSQNKKNIW